MNVPRSRVHSRSLHRLRTKCVGWGRFAEQRLLSVPQLLDTSLSVEWLTEVLWLRRAWNTPLEASLSNPPRILGIMPLTHFSDDNPFQGLITETNNSPVRIIFYLPFSRTENSVWFFLFAQTELQSRYESHRINRNNQQKEKILSESFEGWAIDTILRRVDGPEKEEGYLDPRNCLCIWARPSSSVRGLISYIQSELKEVAPCKINDSLWWQWILSQSF